MVIFFIINLRRRYNIILYCLKGTIKGKIVTRKRRLSLG